MHALHAGGIKPVVREYIDMSSSVLSDTRGGPKSVTGTATMSNQRLFIYCCFMVVLVLSLVPCSCIGVARRCRVYCKISIYCGMDNFTLHVNICSCICSCVVFICNS